jgi:hypothetical protein
MEPTYNAPMRHVIVDSLTKIGLQTGDILVRKSEAKGPFGLPFMTLVQSATKSKYTHAAMVVWIDMGIRVPFVLEITDVGTMFYRLIDWLIFCIDGDLAVYRLNRPLTDEEDAAIKKAVSDTLIADADYDYTFEDDSKFYCVENVVEMYRAAGINLCEPTLIKDIVGPMKWPLIVAGNWLFKKLTKGSVSLPLDEGMYFVGNETNGGLIASPHLVKVVEL